MFHFVFIYDPSFLFVSILSCLSLRFCFIRFVSFSLFSLIFLSIHFVSQDFWFFSPKISKLGSSSSFIFVSRQKHILLFFRFSLLSLAFLHRHHHHHRHTRRKEETMFHNLLFILHPLFPFERKCNWFLVLPFFFFFLWLLSFLHEVDGSDHVMGYRQTSQSWGNTSNVIGKRSSATSLWIEESETEAVEITRRKGYSLIKLIF